MNNSNSPGSIEGVVEAVNERGVRINGEWANVSKFKPVELPDVGALVRLGVDPKGFITTLEVLDDESVHLGVYTSRDPTAMRLAVLQAAAAFCGQYATVHEDVRSSDVLKIADAWLAWVEA